MKKLSIVAILSLLVIVNTAFKLHVNETGNLKISVSNIRSNKGEIEVVLFNKSGGFPDDRKKAYKIIRGKIDNGKCDVVFINIPFDQYAVCVYHDENNNKKIDETWYGMPTEGVGVSNNPKVGILGPPNFERAKFEFNLNKTSLTINMKYL